MLNNIIYIGHMAQLRWTSLSYKNHKRFRKDESEWAVVYNNHEPIISQELWDKVHERKNLSRKAEKQKSASRIRCPDFSFAPTAETR